MLQLVPAMADWWVRWSVMPLEAPLMRLVLLARLARLARLV